MMKKFIYLLMCCLLSVSCRQAEKDVFSIESMSGFPDAEKGISQGVSACFAGSLDDCLIMAGGCNFPDAPASKGGIKRYYKGIYAAKLTDSHKLEWRLVGELPEAAAYGVAITLKDGILCLGGNNRERSLNTVYCIRWKDKEHQFVSVDSVTTLPFTMDNMTGCKVDDYIYLAGGNQDGVPSNRVISISLNHVEYGWDLFPELPGEARVQPVCGTDGRNFYVWGGYDSESTVLALDGFYFDEYMKAWVVADVPRTENGEPLFIAGGSTISLKGKLVIATGGVNATIFQEALLNPGADYLDHPIEWYRFNPYILQFKDNRWKVLADSNGASARAGASLVYHEGILYIVGGELKPGIRSNQVLRVRFEKDV